MPSNSPEFSISLLTGGSDKPYVIGLTKALREKGVLLDLIGSDELDCPELQSRPGINFLNLRGSQNRDASQAAKVSRIAKYYLRLLRYAAFSESKIFHILWNNKFESFDRTLLMLYYRLLGKRIVFTAHNVNAARRDGRDSLLNRLTLRVQYRLAHSIFVHTESMKSELINEFGVAAGRVTTIPFGINNAVPHTKLTSSAAKARLGLGPQHKVILFFGRITPYKGLEFLITAFRRLLLRDPCYRLIIAGRSDSSEEYWSETRASFQEEVHSGHIILRSEFIPDEETEIFFKAGDVLVLPYRQIYQSGVLFLSHSFGLPVLAADVGSLADDIVEGENGSMFKPEDPIALSNAVEKYFASGLYANLDDLRQGIKGKAAQKHSWDLVGRATLAVYEGLIQLRISTQDPSCEGGPAPCGTKSPS